jgi:hypothetical protein
MLPGIGNASSSDSRDLATRMARMAADSETPTVLAGMRRNRAKVEQKHYDKMEKVHVHDPKAENHQLHRKIRSENAWRRGKVEAKAHEKRKELHAWNQGGKHHERVLGPGNQMVRPGYHAKKNQLQGQLDAYHSKQQAKYTKAENKYNKRIHQNHVTVNRFQGSGQYRHNNPGSRPDRVPPTPPNRRLPAAPQI